MRWVPNSGKGFYKFSN